MKRFDPTQAARQIWHAIYDDTWPRGWRVKWGRIKDPTTIEEITQLLPDDWGSTVWQKKLIVLLRHKDHRLNSEIFDTLVHEFVHVRNPDLPHGREFDRLVKFALRKLHKAYSGASAAEALYDNLVAKKIRVSLQAMAETYIGKSWASSLAVRAKLRQR